MHEVVDEKRSPSKKPFIFYAIIALLIIMLLNALVFPSMLQRSVIEVGYDQFLEMIDSGEVKEVSYDEYSGQFVFIGRRMASGCCSSCWNTTTFNFLPPSRHRRIRLHPLF